MPDDKNNPLLRCIGLLLLAAAVVATLAVAGKGAAITQPTVLSLAVAPGEPSLLYAGTSAGIYVSADRGATWRLTLDWGGNYQGIAVDPNDPATVYAAPADGLYRRGRDGHWTRVNTYMGDAWLIPDPKRSGRLWVETASGGLYVPAGDVGRGTRRPVVDPGRRWSSTR